jgi:hypothetical protein
MRFVFGIAVGAIGMWAYKNGKFDSMMGNAPDRMQQAWQPAADRVTQVAHSDQVQQVKSAVQDRMQQARGTDIVTPSATEVSGRPSEPLPTSGA